MCRMPTLGGNLRMKTITRYLGTPRGIGVVRSRFLGSPPCVHILFHQGNPVMITKTEGSDGPYLVNGDVIKVTWGSKTLHGSKTSSWLCWSAAEKNLSARFKISKLGHRGKSPLQIASIRVNHTFPFHFAERLNTASSFSLESDKWNGCLVGSFLKAGTVYVDIPFMCFF